MTTTAVILTTWAILCTVVAAFIALKPLTTVVRVSLRGEDFASNDFVIRECRDDYILLARLDGSDAIRMTLTDEGVEVDRDDSKMTDITERTRDQNWVRR